MQGTFMFGGRQSHSLPCSWYGTGMDQVQQLSHYLFKMLTVSGCWCLSFCPENRSLWSLSWMFIVPREWSPTHPQTSLSRLWFAVKWIVNIHDPQMTNPNASNVHWIFSLFQPWSQSFHLHTRCIIHVAGCYKNLSLFSGEYLSISSIIWLCL